jgi:DeoR/GlpR family transcriptional regulator of sugar metabolism
MLAITRKNKIKEIIIEKKSITVSELSNTFNVT